MDKKPVIPHFETLFENYTLLPRQAEKQVREWPNLESIEYADLPKLINELRIHLSELEIQNEELKRTIKEISLQQNKSNYVCIG